MKSCPECGKKFKLSGLAIHLARVHSIHPQHSDSDSNGTVSESKVCPVPGCGLQVPDLLSHARLFHEEWFLSNGRFVFEVV